MPRKYGERQQLEHTGKDGEAIEINFTIGGHDATN
jgi:hypothetical protein